MSIGIFYGVLKLVEPEASPLLFATKGSPEVLASPFYTNRAFAATVIIVSILLSTVVIALTVKQLRSDVSLYGQPAPFSSPTVISLMALFAMAGVYYFIINVVSGTPWFYSGTLAFIAVLLAVYEGRQYSRDEL
jgi:hypothetical protein